jgi:hypothetical protein
MVQTRSGAAPTQQGGDIPVEVEVPTQVQKVETVPPVSTPQVYTAGTNAATLQRSPSEPRYFRPAQFSFLPQQDYTTAREPSEVGEIIDLGASTNIKQPATTDQAKGRTVMRSLAFEAPMRPMDVSRNMYLD